MKQNKEPTIYIDASTGVEKLFVPHHLLTNNPRFGNNLNAKLLEYLLDNRHTKKDCVRIERKIHGELSHLHALESIDNKYIKSKKYLLNKYKTDLDALIHRVFYLASKDAQQRILGLLRREVDNLLKIYGINDRYLGAGKTFEDVSGK